MTATQNIHGEAVPAAPWNMMVTTFSPENWWALVIYLIAVGCLGLHIAHGRVVGLQTMGWLRGNTRRLIVPLSGLIGALVFLMFAIPPVYLMVTSRRRLVCRKEGKDIMSDTLIDGLYREGEKIADTKAPLDVPLSQCWSQRKFNTPSSTRRTDARSRSSSSVRAWPAARQPPRW
ncbi:hypothetical protein [Nanchangia anserum]|uniref:hypothetical protein n=1 Tax=Nanchangia anserum TaxID=2692125 RepID=UPI001D111FAE|nr:hypothetical protein [Nanchangia anserum]